MELIDSILKYWLGNVEETVIPTQSCARIWFSESPEVDEEIKSTYGTVHRDLVSAEHSSWMASSRAKLAKIIVLDQFSRHIYRDQPASFAYDKRALETCLQGLNELEDHNLSLIERIFFYYPLLHSEELVYQEQGVIAYSSLADLAFDETRVVYDSFLQFAHHHYNIIQRFGRFPQRNAILGRETTSEEQTYLDKEAENQYY